MMFVAYLAQSMVVARVDEVFQCMRYPSSFKQGRNLRCHAAKCKGTPNAESDVAPSRIMDRFVYPDDYPELAAYPSLLGLVCLCCKVFVGVDQVYRHFRKPGHANKSKPAIDSILAKFTDRELIKDSTELHNFLKSQPVEPALHFLDPAQKHYWCLTCESGLTTEKGWDDEFAQAINNTESFYLQKIGFTNNPVYRKCLTAVFGKQSFSQRHRSRFDECCHRCKVGSW
jgi:hypothetical protein